MPAGSSTVAARAAAGLVNHIQSWHCRVSWATFSTLNWHQTYEWALIYWSGHFILQA